jgi:signal transduction histidine kinase
MPSKIRSEHAVEHREWPEELEEWALQIEQERADFIDMLAHDVQNRLFVILNYTDILRERAQERSSHEDREVLDSLKGNCLALHELITTSLNLGQLHARFSMLHKVPVDVNTILDRVFQQFMPEAERRRISLDRSLAESLPPIEGDSLALERVFANLLHNALKFTPASGRVMLTSHQRADGIVVAVADTGPGIAADDALLLTSAEEPAGAAASGARRLGLRIVRALVSVHSGRIEVRSAPQAGSCVSIHFRPARAARRAVIPPVGQA